MFLLETLLIQKISFIIFFEKKFQCDKIKKIYLRKGKRFFFFLKNTRYFWIQEEIEKDIFF